MSTFDEQTDFSFLVLDVSKPTTAKKVKVKSVPNTDITLSRIHGEETRAKMAEARTGKPGYWLGKKRPDISELRKGPRPETWATRSGLPIMTPQGLFNSMMDYCTFMNKTRGWITSLKTKHPDHYYIIKNFDPSVKYEVPAEPPKPEKRVVSDETRAKLVASRIGKKHSAETLAKMAEAKLGKSKSAETKAKMSASQINYNNTEDSLNKKRKLIMTPAGVFKGRKAAAKGNGITLATLDRRLYHTQCADYYTIKEAK